MDWIDCFPIFVLGVVYKRSFLGYILYFNYVLDQHSGNNSEKYLELLYVPYTFKHNENFMGKQGMS